MVEPRATTVRAESLEETLRLGELLGRSLRGGLCIALIGPLGAGKTHLVKGVAGGNGLVDPRRTTSPTFTLIQEYPGRFTLYHIDVYRLRGPAELIALGVEELVRADSVVLVEWADRVREVIPQPLLTVEIEPRGDNARRFRLTPEGDAAVECLRELTGALASDSRPSAIGS